MKKITLEFGDKHPKPQYDEVVGKINEIVDWVNQDKAKIIDDQPDISKSLAPYRCPICGGNGLVSGAFYTSLLGCVGTSANITDQCRTCKGAGIIWG